MKVKLLDVKPKGWGDNANKGYPCKFIMKGMDIHLDKLKLCFQKCRKFGIN